MPLTFRLTPGQLLHCHSWDDQIVLYNEVSGATHLLDAGTFALLHALRDGSLTADEWDDPELQETLAMLAKLYLIEAC